MAEARYAALTGDLVASRDAAPDHRRRAQQETLRVLAELGRRLGDVLVRPLALTAGDEIQGCLRAPSAVVEVVQELTDRLQGLGPRAQDVVFGVGWGTLSTGLLPEAVSVEHLDGPCFHHARAALARAKKERIWVVARGFGEVEDQVLESLFDLMGAIRSGWTPTQRLYASDARVLPKRVDVARRHQVSPSVVTESLQLSRFDAVVRGEEAARALLRGYDPGTVAGKPSA